MNSASLKTLQSLPCLTLCNSSDVFSGEKPGLDLIQLDHPQCSAVIALQGAQILSFNAKDQAPLLWMSPNARFIEGKAVRGGIPICAPWFGPHKEDKSKPQHGFARNLVWELSGAQQNDSDVVLRFELESSTEQLNMHPWPLRLTLTMTFGRTLTLDISVKHLAGASSREPMPFTWALHTYFQVDDIGKTYIRGLGQNEDFRFNGEVDQVLNQIPLEQSIHCDGMAGQIKIKGDNCPSAIVWNPGREKAAGMGDLGAANFAQFVCVERGAAGEDSWMIEPGETREASVKFWWEPC